MKSRLEMLNTSFIPELVSQFIKKDLYPVLFIGKDKWGGEIYQFFKILNEFQMKFGLQITLPDENIALKNQPT